MTSGEHQGDMDTSYELDRHKQTPHHTGLSCVFCFKHIIITTYHNIMMKLTFTFIYLRDLNLVYPTIQVVVS